MGNICLSRNADEGPVHYDARTGKITFNELSRVGAQQAVLTRSDQRATVLSSPRYNFPPSALPRRARTVSPYGVPASGLSQASSSRVRRRLRQALHANQSDSEDENIISNIDPQASSSPEDLSLAPFLPRSPSPRRTRRKQRLQPELTQDVSDDENIMTPHSAKASSPRRERRASPRSPSARAQVVTIQNDSTDENTSDENSPDENDPYTASDLVQFRGGIIFKDDHISAARSVQDVVMYLLDEGVTEEKQMYAFLLATHVLIHPRQLIYDAFEYSKLTLRWLKFSCFMDTWSNLMPFQFMQDPIMISDLRLIRKHLADAYRGQEMSTEFTKFMINQRLRLEPLIEYETLYKEKLEEVETDPTVRLENPDMTIRVVCPNPKILAEELVCLEMEKFTQIGPEELVKNVFQDAAARKRYQNTTMYEDWSDRLKSVVATEVCLFPGIESANLRAEVIGYFIDVANECLKIGNFNALIMIVSALCCTEPVLRLQDTWKWVDKDKIQSLNYLRHISLNVGNYKALLQARLVAKECVGIGGYEKNYIIPSYNSLKHDVIWCNNCLPNNTDNDLVNFEKFWKMATLILDYTDCRQTVTIRSRPRVNRHMVYTAIFTETYLELQSYECEPPRGTNEQQRYEYLKELYPDINPGPE